MRAKLDENLPVEAAELLRTAGWECHSVYDEGLAGADDPEVASACQAGARVLFTLDLDFADIRAYPPSEYLGIVVLQPTPRASGPVGGMDGAPAVDCGARARSRAWRERAHGVKADRTDAG
jgi:hypothetical protein